MSHAPRSGEDRLLAWLRHQPGTSLLGDDAALLAPSGPSVATVDSQIAGVHVPADLDAGLLAERLLQVNLSDLAAMGAAKGAATAVETETQAGAPADPGEAAPWCHALVALATPEAFDHRHFFSVLLNALAANGVALAGGDLASSPTLSATMTLIARPPADWRPLRRSAARPGDALWVGGTLGESGAGLRLLRRGARLTAHGERAHVFLPRDLRGDETVAAAARSAVRRHLVPRAQLALGAWLAARPETVAGADEAAALDLSDGLARDLPRMARESGVGAEVDAAELPLAEGFAELCAALDNDPIDLALGGGEDYVLLFTLPEGIEPPEGFGCRRIGRVTEGEELVLVRDGGREGWPEMGWDHVAHRPSSS